MELTFNKTGELYVAEFKADKEFSLHIERMNGLGSIKMQQNGAEGGKYADVEDFEASNSTKPVIEYDSGAFVAPKWIRIESSVLPTYAAITTDGDVVEIKSQAKVVEITSNGTTSVEPDAGFSYLSKVDVKTNVPTEGGGGEGGSGGTGRDIEYFSVTNNESAGELIFLMSLVKLDYSGNISIITSAGYIDVTDSNRANLIAIGIDMTLPIVMDGVRTTPREWFESNGLSDLSIFGWTPMTEEEFYTL